VVLQHIIFREATVDDIKQIQTVRNSVTENMLSNPNLVTDKHCEEFLTIRGKGWVCEVENEVVGFAIADLVDHNIWALFLTPNFEKRGIGTQLHTMMLDWYFTQTKDTVWLGTAFNTRAEKFYRKAGWTEVGTHGSDEIKFEMTYDSWLQIRQAHNTLAAD
jgi:GNAT superfamily N-acetyltransferase